MTPWTELIVGVSGNSMQRTVTSYVSHTGRMRLSHVRRPTVDCVKRIILIRNGESLANADVGEYYRTPDWKIPLSPNGIAQSRAIGSKLVSIIGEGSPAYTYFSPYLRSKHTALHAVDECRSKVKIIGIREDARLRDGDIGHFESEEHVMRCIKEREAYGKFFYRFPNGESGADVSDRVTSFLDAFQREKYTFPMDTNVVIVSHGQWIRHFLARWYHLNISTFEQLRSPPLGSLTVMTRARNGLFFKLDENALSEMNIPRSLSVENGYQLRNKAILGSISLGAPYM